MMNLPAIENDETLYSLCATAHSMSASSSSQRSSLSLIGTLHGTLQHDLPASIQWLVECRLAEKDTASKVARRHSIAAYYFPFVSPSRLPLISDLWLAGKTTHARRLIQSSSRTLPVAHPLKWCGACIEEDLRKLGRSYWHVAHQFPTTWRCSRHDFSLAYIEGRHKRWLLPRSCLLQRSATVPSGNAAMASILSTVGETASKLESVQITSIRQATLNRLQAMGVIHSTRRVHHDRILAWFRSNPLSTFLRQAPAGLARFSEGEWIAPMLWRQKRSNAVRWVLLWSALDWSTSAEAGAFFCDAASSLPIVRAGQIELFEEALPTPDTPLKVSSVLESASSYEEAMRILQVPRNQIVRWLEADPETRARWRQRLQRERVENALRRLLDSVLLDPSISSAASLSSADLRLLKSHAPQEYEAITSRLASFRPRQGTLPFIN